ncbi:Sporulation stage II protein D, amidase enhancer LytB N-terminal [Acididesulfobacillus acetoxydans]|uniref:Sporulation stage II protein D, amidase enhancer LytB N-terminal n=1 Tax=Acididesulfobacillus acetoxydans TaxID=1561005 RepID=A0A8S0WYU4_9FIRM|nr:Sporulation stage II protein D, amidase enhancer LytB N-terminal [Acididesulfobacillus acetoxydans]CEJ09100.1 Stage II sporulation protein [Acididesulfobacillus acetoxydans]
MLGKMCRRAFFLSLLCLCFVFVRPLPLQAKTVDVQLVWKFGQTGWAQVTVEEGTYRLQEGSQVWQLKPGESLQLGWAGFAPVWRLNQAAFQWAEPETFELKGNGSFFLVNAQGSKVVYRGSLVMAWAGDRWRFTNVLDSEDYLKGVVPIEMSNAWAKNGLEALKAQAVAARTYLARHTESGSAITDSPNRDQAYLGKSVEGAASAAVGDTRGVIMVDAHTHRPIDALYSSNDGGYTEDAQNVWSNPDPHYVAKPDPYSVGVGGPTADWYFVISAPELGKTFGLGPVRKIQLDKFPSGRVKSVRLEDDRGKKLSVSGRSFVQKFYPSGPIETDDFLGTLFTDRFVPTKTSTPLTRLLSLRNPLTVLPGPRLGKIISSNEGTLPYDQPDGAFIFSGHGWGHGVGMSQWGAYHMAELGFTYPEILNFYYADMVLARLP